MESFYDTLAHFANGGMQESLADNLNLTGTAQYNLVIRHKRRISRLSHMNADRAKTPPAWETTILYFNHLELAYLNKLAKQDDHPKLFPYVEPLPQNTGEHFFSEYLTWLKKRKIKAG